MNAAEHLGITEEDLAMARESQALLRALREPTYARDDVLPDVVDKPYVFYAPDLCGSYAIFIFGSYRCDKYTAGLCTPCHYSGLLHPAATPKAQVFNGILGQVDYLLENFNELVASHQTGTGEGYRVERRHPEGRFYDIQISGEGSFLRDGEVPRPIRRQILEKLAKYADDNALDLHVGLEVKAEDIVRAERTGELAEWGDLVDRLHLTLIMGFESANHFIRNVIFNKRLSLDAVEQAIEIGHRRSMRPTCFVYAGSHALTEQEVIEDVKKSIGWLRERGAGVYLMAPNLQPHTIPHVLYHADGYDLIDVRTMLTLVEELVAEGRGETEVHYRAGWDWNIGGVTSEPDPELNIFTNPKSATCEGCRRAARMALFELASKREVEVYRATINQVQVCKCKGRYEQRLEKSATDAPLHERVTTNHAVTAALTPTYVPTPTVLHTGPARSSAAP